jgi:V/A-type H+-transporting ATPase subunit D
VAKKIKLTRPELKRHRDALQRFQRYLPMLKLKQQQLQLMIRNVTIEIEQSRKDTQAALDTFEPYKAILIDRAGVNFQYLASPSEIRTTTENIAGVRIPVFEGVDFPPPSYSLFATPAWVDGALADQKHINACRAQLDVLRKQFELLQKELTKIIQRVNLFEKVKIPEAQEAIRRIRIHLGDEMTAAVGRAKIAKGKILKSESTIYGGREVKDGAEEMSVKP